jgi:hypothetical protein
MTTTIVSVTLDRDMIFEDEFNYSIVDASTVRTLGGGLIVQEFQGTEKGRRITLVSTDSQGLQKKSTVAALRALSDVSNATYQLSIASNSKTFSRTVRFVNEESGGPVQFTPFQVRDGLHSDDIWYRGTIHLMVTENTGTFA